MCKSNGRTVSFYYDFADSEFTSMHDFCYILLTPHSSVPMCGPRPRTPSRNRGWFCPGQGLPTYHASRSRACPFPLAASFSIHIPRSIMLAMIPQPSSSISHVRMSRPGDRHRSFTMPNRTAPSFVLIKSL